MELVHHIANATFSSSRTKNKSITSLEKLASKQKTFRIVKEHTARQSTARSRESIKGWWARVIAPNEMSTCSTRQAMRAGGASRDRTGDLLVANQTLSQLSYGPSHAICPEACRVWWVWEELHPRPHPYQGCALTN